MTGAPVKEAAGSQLARIRARRQEIVENLHLDLKVPRWDDDGDFPPVYVRYRPIPIGKLIEIGERSNQDKDPDAVMQAEAALLVELCDGVYMLGPDGQATSFDPEGALGDWPKPGPRLAAALGVDSQLPSVDVLRNLYFTDGDLVEASDKLAVWSRRKAEEADVVLAGESKATRR